jgi:hypothetical protein
MMGQQQLLLIVLGIIVVGTTVIVGMSIAGTYSEEANRDGVTSDLIHLSSLAKSHYHRPTTLGGGGCTFANFVIPDELDTTGHGTFEHTQQGHKTDHIHFTGYGTAIGNDGENPVTIEVRISINEVKFKTIN